jgi:hypothetical protein
MAYITLLGKPMSSLLQKANTNANPNPNANASRHHLKIAYAFGV